MGLGLGRSAERAALATDVRSSKLVRPMRCLLRRAMSRENGPQIKITDGKIILVPKRHYVVYGEHSGSTLFCVKCSARFVLFAVLKWTKNRAKQGQLGGGQTEGKRACSGLLFCLPNRPDPHYKWRASGGLSGGKQQQAGEKGEQKRHFGRQAISKRPPPGKPKPPFFFYFFIPLYFW